MVTVKLCVLDVDYVLEDAGSAAPDGDGLESTGKQERIPVIRIWGKARDGKSVLVIDRGFRPYFYVEPREGLSLDQLNDLAERLENVEIEVSEGENESPLEVVLEERKFLSVPKKVFRVTVKRPDHIARFRDALQDWGDVREEYEYSFSFYKRYMIDMGFSPMEWIEVSGDSVEVPKDHSVDRMIEISERPRVLKEEEIPALRVMGFDIETSMESGKEEVIMISMADNKGFSRVLTYRGKRKKGMENLKDEKGMLERFVKLVKDRNPDFIVGYNTDRFDFVRIDARAEALGVRLDFSRDGTRMVFKKKIGVTAAKIAGRPHIDLYNFIDNIMKWYMDTETLSLDKVAKELVGEGKEEMAWKDMEALWKDGKGTGKLADYCLKDSRLALRLGENLLPQVFELGRVSGMTPFDASRMRYSSLVEWLLMRKAHGFGELSPNRPRGDEVRKRRMYPSYTGGYVLPPVEGIHEKLALYDFASLYPSITITHNVSPETLDCMCCRDDRGSGDKNGVPESEHYFCRRHRGFIPMVLEEIVGQRQKVKRRMRTLKEGTKVHRMLDNRQRALKILANASYGYYAYPGSRWYSRMCAQSITAWGRFYIRKVTDLAKKRGFEVIYGDTDSLFVKAGTKKAAREFLKKSNESLPGVMELELEGIYKAGIFVLAKTGMAAKKRYALLGEKGKIIIRGFEIVRRDWSPIAKETQEGVIKAILRDRSPEKAVGIVKDNVERLKSGKVGFDELVIYSQITKPLNQYEQVGPHVVAARKAQERGRKIRPGTSIALIITRGSGSISSRAEPMEDAGNYDPEYYIRNQVVPAALRVLSGLGYKEDDLVGESSGPPQSSLEGFFKGK